LVDFGLFRAVRATPDAVRALGCVAAPRTDAHVASRPKREFEVLQLSAERRTNAEIAVKLVLSQKTVRADARATGIGGDTSAEGRERVITLLGGFRRPTVTVRSIPGQTD